MLFDQSVYSIEKLIQESFCSICRTKNPDFFKSPTEFFHLSCYLSLYKDSSQISSLIQPALMQPSYMCSVCKSVQDIYNCVTCNQIFCLVCAWLSPTRLCCPNFQALLMQTPKLCEGCEYLKPIQSFCLSSKCDSHDYLCQKCFDLGQESFSCVFGCSLADSCKSFVNCNLCESLQMKYQGEVSCMTNCEICELCFYRSYLKNQKTCAVCQEVLLRKS